jgi:high-affinity nickel-transport protein
MSSFITRIFSDSSSDLRGKIAALLALLVGFNLVAWGWALTSFHSFPVLLGTALLAYGFGLRHAVDADHIAAIDNVTRKMMQQGKRPVAVGFMFSLGHSTVVVLASIAVAVAANSFKMQLDALHHMGGVIGTMISSAFLLLIAIMNLAIFSSIAKAFQRVRHGGPYSEDDFDMLLANRGFLSRLLRPLFGLISESWHMYPLGFLFGLGFDTATEISLLGISATEAAKGLPVWSILVFPILFTAGMSLIDSIDGIMMLGAYGWAFIKPIRKLYYNMTITLVSVVVAIVVGGIEALGLIGDQLKLEGPVWKAIGSLNDHFGTIGYLIIGIFAVSWALSLMIYRFKGFDRLEAGIH